jgi:predicted CoA-binding protein
MTTVKQAASEFLAQKRIAVTGVSRAGKTHGANVVYQRLRERGYDVFAVNPNASNVEGDLTFPSLHAIPGGVDAVVIGTAAERAPATMREAVELGVHHVWMHRSFGPGRVSREAAEYGRAHDVSVIAGGCPLMFAPTSDGGHKVIKSVCRLTGALPRKV